MEITVVNIQKFKDDPSAINNNDYNLKIQSLAIFYCNFSIKRYN